MGGKAFSVHAEGERLLLRHEGGEPKEIALTGGGTPAGEVPASCVEAAGEDPAPEAELVDGPDCDAAIAVRRNANTASPCPSRTASRRRRKATSSPAPAPLTVLKELDIEAPSPCRISRRRSIAPILERF